MACPPFPHQIREQAARRPRRQLDERAYDAPLDARRQARSRSPRAPQRRPDPVPRGAQHQRGDERAGPNEHRHGGDAGCDPGCEDKRHEAVRRRGDHAPRAPDRDCPGGDAARIQRGDHPPRRRSGNPQQGPLAPCRAPVARGGRLGAEQGAQGLNQRSPRRPARGPLHEHQHVGASARIAAAGRADADPEGIGRPASEARLEEGNGTPGAEFVLLCAFRKRAPQGRRGRESVVRFGRRGSSDHAVEPGRQIGPKRARPVAFRRRRGR